MCRSILSVNRANLSKLAAGAVQCSAVCIPGVWIEGPELYCPCIGPCAAWLALCGYMRFGFLSLLSPARCCLGGAHCGLQP